MPRFLFAPAAPQLDCCIHIHQYIHICPQSALNHIGNACKSGKAADQVNLCNPPPFNRFPESAGKADVQISKKPTPSDKIESRFFIFFSFLFAIISPTSKNSRKTSQKNRLPSSLCCTEEITNHIHRTLLIIYWTQNPGQQNPRKLKHSSSSSPSSSTYLLWQNHNSEHAWSLPFCASS